MSDEIISRQPFERSRIIAGAQVSMHFSILMEDGRQVDSTRGGQPAQFVVGDGNLPEGFERVLIGLEPGDDGQFEIEPEDAFGAHRQENIQWMPEGRFDGMDLEPGLIVSFAQAEGELPGVVQRIENGKVCVDFNHPLAGKRLIFDVSVISVTPPANRSSD